MYNLYCLCNYNIIFHDPARKAVSKTGWHYSKLQHHKQFAWYFPQPSFAEIYQIRITNKKPKQQYDYLSIVNQILVFYVISATDNKNDCILKRRSVSRYVGYLQLFWVQIMVLLHFLAVFEFHEVVNYPSYRQILKISI